MLHFLPYSYQKLKKQVNYTIRNSTVLYYSRKNYRQFKSSKNPQKTQQLEKVLSTLSQKKSNKNKILKRKLATKLGLKSS